MNSMSKLPEHYFISTRKESNSGEICRGKKMFFECKIISKQIVLDYSSIGNSMRHNLPRHDTSCGDWKVIAGDAHDSTRSHSQTHPGTQPNKLFSRNSKISSLEEAAEKTAIFQWCPSL